MNEKLKLTLFLALVVLFVSSCSKWLENEKLTLQKTPYTGNELRLDGYYYDMEDGKIWSTYFFYRNGILHYGIASDTLDNDLVKYDAWFASEYYSEHLRSGRRRWGVFEIHDDSIVFERWGILEGGDPVLRFSGRILNDTTFIITKCENPHSGEFSQENDLYHFRHFSPKPDSTNMFIP